MKCLIAYVATVLIVHASARTMTVYNNCPFTIWPAIFTTPGRLRPSQVTGWTQTSFESVSFSVPDSWGGRIWGRRDCDFDVPNPGPNSCLDGGCVGGLECDPKTGTGVPPATLAEFNLGATDNYDVSIVDGYNLPMKIINDAGCPAPSCPVDLGPNCPMPLKGPYEPSGFPVGCRSACSANLDKDPTNSPNCCTGYYSSPSTCPSSGVQYYSYFKANCPTAIAYAFDNAEVTCNQGSTNYNISFCD
ncbi:Osmotin thaumatin-like protein [Cubamyces menziesii]|nr:Osmotin thaumatin-like protein [Cubamyces menziesii]